MPAAAADAATASRNGSPPAAAGQPDEPRWRVRLTHRMMIEGTRRGVGEVIQVPHHYLRVAAHWVRCGAGVPADERTRHAVELFEAARRLP